MAMGIKKARILVVDDTPISRMGTVLMLETVGFSTDQAEDGLECLEKAASTSYDAIIMDCNMPRMNGLECTYEIRAMESAGGLKPIPIIGFTAQPDLKSACLQAGMNDCLPRSEKDEVVIATIRSYIEASIR